MQHLLSIPFFSWHGMTLLLTLVGFEVMLSLDNAVAMALQAKHLPKRKQTKALTQGVWIAILWRMFILSVLSIVLDWKWLEIGGGLYLTFIGAKNLWFPKPQTTLVGSALQSSYYGVIMRIEILNIFASFDSILTSMTYSQELSWLMLGATLGILIVRFASRYLIHLLEIFPQLQKAGSMLIFASGIRALAQIILPEKWSTGADVLDWCYWITLAMIVIYALSSKRQFVPQR